MAARRQGKRPAEAGLPCRWDGRYAMFWLMAWLDRNPHSIFFATGSTIWTMPWLGLTCFAKTQKTELPKVVDVAGDGTAIASQLLGERGKAQLPLSDRLDNPKAFLRQAFHHVDWIGKGDGSLGSSRSPACLPDVG